MERHRDCEGNVTINSSYPPLGEWRLDLYKLPIAPGGIALSREKPEKPAIIIGLLDPQRPCFYPY